MQIAPILRRGLTFAELSAGLAFVVIAALGCMSPAQSDTFWALRAGEDIWRTGRIPLVDTYSYTAAGRPWPNHEWLWQALVYALYRTGGFPLVAAAAGAMLTGAYLIAYRLMAGKPAIRLSLLAIGVTLGSSGWSLRPQVASLLLLSVFLWFLVHGRYWLIPPLFALWANVHGVVALGLALLVVALVCAFFFARERAGRLVLVTGLAMTATLLSPLGPGLWSFVLGWIVAPRRTGVTEWAHITLASPEGIAFSVAGAGFAILVFRRWRTIQTWPDRLLVLLALALLGAACHAVRNAAPFMLIAMPAASRLIARGAPSGVVRASSLPIPPSEHPRANLVVLVLGTVTALTVVSYCWAVRIERLGWRPIGQVGVSAIAACGKPLYNSYEVGGIIIWFVRDTPVFIDSRHDPYPPEFIIADREVEKGVDAQDFFRDHGFRCAVVAADARLGAALRRFGWRPRFQGGKLLVLEPP
ncbi:MAG: hypothetical protein JXP73_12315 [Deltaproteobacteria bacterium]|nr:hypothetical protein [Deltaproteobacteria bacterium]